jgi:hypothetical protein
MRSLGQAWVSPHGLRINLPLWEIYEIHSVEGMVIIKAAEGYCVFCTALSNNRFKNLTVCDDCKKKLKEMKRRGAT